MAIKQPHEVSERTRDRVEELLGRLKGEQVSQWVMDELFSAAEREVAARYANQKNEQRRLDPNQAEKRDRLPHAVHRRVDVLCRSDKIPKAMVITQVTFTTKNASSDRSVSKSSVAA
jgi:hypothetical protein